MTQTRTHEDDHRTGSHNRPVGHVGRWNGCDGCPACAVEFAAVELSRRTFRATVTGKANWRVDRAAYMRGEDPAIISGPALVDVVITQRDGCWASYSVEIDGVHQFGGVADHLPADGAPDRVGGALIIHDEIVETPPAVVGDGYGPREESDEDREREAAEVTRIELADDLDQDLAEAFGCPTPEEDAAAVRLAEHEEILADVLARTKALRDRLARSHDQAIDLLRAAASHSRPSTVGIVERAELVAHAAAGLDAAIDFLDALDSDGAPGVRVSRAMDRVLNRALETGMHSDRSAYARAGYRQVTQDLRNIVRSVG